MEEEILMKKSKYSDAQIMAILKQAENGVPVADLCREHGMSSAGGVRTMRTSLRFDLNPRPSLQGADATRREQRYGSA